MDEKLINSLVNVLEQETNIYEDMLGISKNKTSIIVEGKLAELESIVKVEQSFVLQMSKLEAMREDIVNKIAMELKVPSDNINISALTNHASGSQVASLKEKQKKMSSIINDLKNTNDVNSKLIKNSLDYINFSINLITSTDDINNNYGTGGYSEQGSKKRLFDMKL